MSDFEDESPERGYEASALLTVIYEDGSTDNTTFSFQPELYAVQVQQATLALRHRSRVSALVLMLWCTGFRGAVHFWDIQASVVASNARYSISSCPQERAIPRSLMSSTTMEVIQQGLTPHSSDLITFATHSSIDRLSCLPRLAASWRGPLAVVVYVPCCPHQPSRVRLQFTISTEFTQTYWLYLR